MQRAILFKNGTRAFKHYGKCFGKPLDKNEYFKLRKSTKFYLAIENSRCTDYITEKFWQTIRYGQVPIVSGPSRETYQKFIPGSAFIHLDDFDGKLGKLAGFINYLLKNETAYLRYFDWRNDPSILESVKYSNRESYSEQGFCKLCSIAHHPESAKTIKNLHNWWYKGQNNQGPACKPSSKINVK